MSKICDDLRAAIFQAAMQGKLTKREPNDDNVEELCKKIVKEHSVFKPNKFIEKNHTEIIIPDEWSSLKSGEVFELITGEKITDGEYLPLLDAKYFRGKQFSKTNKGALADKDDVLILVDGENSGETFLCAEPGYMGSTFKVLFMPSCINRAYALYFLEMKRKVLRNNKRGAAIPHLDKKLFFNFIFPIPSLAEQKRIVEKVDELMARVADLEKSTDALASLKNTFPGDIKASLLQAAMQGKLTKQLPEDGNAEDLLEEIKAEKEKLIAEGKIKKQKPLTPITDNEIPFSVPENWRWARFGRIVDFNIGKTPPRADASYWGKDISWISIADMPESGTVNTTKEKISKKAFDEQFKSKICTKGTLIMSFKLTVGRCSVLNIDAVHNEAIISIIPIVDGDYIFRDYLKTMLPLLTNYGKSKDAIKGRTLNSNSLNNLLIPVPPLAEQKRIVERLDTLMQNINVVENLIASE